MLQIHPTFKDTAVIDKGYSRTSVLGRLRDYLRLLIKRSMLCTNYRVQIFFTCK